MRTAISQLESEANTISNADFMVVDQKSGSNSSTFTTKKVSVGTIRDAIAGPMDEKVDACVKKAGDAMTGKLVLSGSPTDDMHAATKKYVDEMSSRVPDGLLDQIFDMVHPVGSIYISMVDGIPEAFVQNGREWERIATGRTLWNAEDDSKIGQTVDSALPAIPPMTSEKVYTEELSTLYDGFDNHCEKPRYIRAMSSAPEKSNVTVTMQDGDAVYGRSEIVQPPAVYVSMWRRVR